MELAHSENASRAQFSDGIDILTATTASIASQSHFWIRDGERALFNADDDGGLDDLGWKSGIIKRPVMLCRIIIFDSPVEVFCVRGHVSTHVNKTIKSRGCE